MTKSSLVRWLLDLAVIIMFAYASWSFSELRLLHENDIIHATQLNTISDSVVSLNKSLDRLTAAMDEQNDQLAKLVTLATYRTDPWSGKMMLAFQHGWFDWVKKQDPDIQMSDMPDVYQIQREYAEELIPEDLR